MALIIPISLIVITILIAGIAIALFIFNQSRQGWWFAIGIFCSSVGSFAYGMELFSSGLEAKFFWIVTRYISLSLFVMVATRSTLYFLGVPSKIKWLVLGLGGIIPATAIFLLVTYPSSRWMYDQVWMDNSGMIPVLKKTIGPFYWVEQIYLMLLLLTLIILILFHSRSGSGLQRAQSMIISGGLFLPVITNLIYLLNIRPWGFLNISVFSYFISAVLLWYGVQRYHLAKIRPVARNLLFEKMQDGILVIDPSGIVFDTNPSAAAYLNAGSKTLVGQSLLSVAPDVAKILAQIKNNSVSEALLQLNGINLQVTSSTLGMTEGQSVGDLIILRDVNARMEAEQLNEIENDRRTAWRERRIIARTLHDSITQYLNSLVLLSVSAQKRLAQAEYDKLPSMITNIETGSRQALEEMRVMIQEMQLESPSLMGFDLIKSIKERISLVTGAETELLISLAAPKKLKLDYRQQKEIFFILVEALNNVMLHSRASSININLKQTPVFFSAEMIDNGCGFDPANVRAADLGLANMRQRAQQLGGQLSITSSPGAGTGIRLEIPIREFGSHKGIHNG